MSETPFKILIVDDEGRNLALMEALLKPEGYVTAIATNGRQALDTAKHFKPDLILLDIMMPEMDGIDTAGWLKVDPDTKTVPIIMVTALDDRDSKLRALSMGAEEFLTKPVDRAELYVRVRNLLRLREYSKFLVNHNRILEEKVRTRTSQLTESYRETIASLNRAAAYRDEQTGAHVVRISYYCTALAEALGMDAGFRDCIFYASPMHDLGKIAIPDHILFKPGGLTPEEWEIMKTHAELGARMLERGESPYIRMGRDIALSHHERWDGTGYPKGLGGEQIPLSARIMQLTDVYDALRSPRPYKPPFTHERSLEIILKGDGRTQPGHFDPEVLLAFRGMTARFQEIYEVHADEAAPDARVAA